MGDEQHIFGAHITEGESSTVPIDMMGM